MLLNRHEVGQDLRRVKPISQAIPDRHAGIPSQLLNRLVGKATKLNTVKHPAEHLGSVFDCLFLAQLNIIFAKIFWCNPEVISCHRKCTASAGRSFFKQESNIFALMNPVWNPRIFQSLILMSSCQK